VCERRQEGKSHTVEINHDPVGEAPKQPIKHWEDRPGWAACFAPRHPKSDHPADFVGVTVLDGKKYWVRVYKKLDKNNNRYVTVQLREYEEGEQ
jgi:hypothetical protein